MDFRLDLPTTFPEEQEKGCWTFGLHLGFSLNDLQPSKTQLVG